MKIFITLRGLLLYLLLLALCFCGEQEAEDGLREDGQEEDPNLAIRRGLLTLLQSGKHLELLDHLKVLEDKHGTLRFGEQFPTLYGIRGVAFHNAMRMEEAEQAFMDAVKNYPNDDVSWYNLGEIRLQRLNLTSSILAFREAITRGNPDAYNGLLRAQGWSNDWQRFENIVAKVEAAALACVTNSTACKGSIGLEYTALPGHVQRILTTHTPYAQLSSYQVALQNRASLSSKELPPSQSQRRGGSATRLKVGIVSSDFGIHPVATLIRGVVQALTEHHSKEIELFAFALYPETSYWGLNVTNTVEHFVSLNAMNTPDAADLIASLKIDILIDLNGHTQHSGLTIMTHRPAPVQMSFLGWPLTTGSTFIDFFLADAVAVPPEQSNQFTESLSLMPPCYIANDYAQMQGDIVEFFSNGDLRGPRSAIQTATPGYDIENAQILLATLSNSMKIDGSIFDVWMNILRIFPGAKFIFVQHKGSETARDHHERLATMHGIKDKRIVPMPQAAWIEHLYAKSSIDLVLDTVSKNGHTTGLDGIWAGIPSLSFSSGVSSSARAGATIAAALGTEVGLAPSLKAYEDMAFRLLRDSRAKAKHLPRDTPASRYAALSEILEESAPLLASKRLHGMREELREKRLTSTLFDTTAWTSHFARQMQATWEASHFPYPNNNNSRVHTLENPQRRIFQVFAAAASGTSSSAAAAPSPRKRIATNQVYSGSTGVFSTEKFYTRRGLEVPASASDGSGGSETGGDRAKGSSSSSENGATHKLKSHSSTFEGAFPPIPSRVFYNEFVFLNIGGQQPKTGWWNVNSQPSKVLHFQDGATMEAHTDVIRPMDDLRGFPDANVSAIYSSHTLEHASFGDGMVSKVLKEWFRVLKAGGLLLISVPDLPTLAQLYLSPGIGVSERFHITKMMFGAQSDAYDYHHIGFDEDLLRHFVEEAGFCNFRRVGNFNIHNDTSLLQYKGRTISLNIAAHKCYTEDEMRAVKESGATDFMVEHGADPYVPPNEL